MYYCYVESGPTRRLAGGRSPDRTVGVKSTETYSPGGRRGSSGVLSLHSSSPERSIRRPWRDPDRHNFKYVGLACRGVGRVALR